MQHDYQRAAYGMRHLRCACCQITKMPLKGVLNRCEMNTAIRHVCSEAGSSRGAGGALPGAGAAAAVPRQAAAASGTSPEAGKLFAKVVAAEHSAQHEAPVQLPHSTARRIAGALGNALLLGGLGAGAFFGYYTYRYSPAEIDAMIDARSASDAAEAAGPVSEVRCLPRGAVFGGGAVLGAKRLFQFCSFPRWTSSHR